MKKGQIVTESDGTKKMTKGVPIPISFKSKNQKYQKLENPTIDFLTIVSGSFNYPFFT